jgi:NAD(P)-dependent dehydrogenase (short-subunit alcohol dehydrogenase family)
MKEIKQKKVALITGGSRGIGKGIAVALASAGYTIAITYNSDFSKATQTATEIEAITGDVVSVFQGDVSDSTVAQSIVHEAVEAVYGRIDLLVNNAGIYERSSFDDLDPVKWQRTIDVNLTGVYNMCDHVVPVMKKQGGGVIINVASQLAFMASTRGAHYTASKAGVVGFSRSLALELASDGIRINVVAPGMIDNTSILDVYDAEEKKKRAKTIPLGRLGLPEDIGNAVVFLASEKASYITGTTLHVNGGYFIQ